MAIGAASEADRPRCHELAGPIRCAAGLHTFHFAAAQEQQVSEEAGRRRSALARPILAYGPFMRHIALTSCPIYK